MTDSDYLRETYRALKTDKDARLIREKAGYTQEEVALKLGVKRPTVSRWEHGHRFPRLGRAIQYGALLEHLKERAI